MPSEIVDVQLVGQQWWQDVLPLAALVVSGISIWLTLQFRYGDSARLKLVSSVQIPVGMPEKDAFLQVEATNVGRTQSTVVRAFKLVLPDGTQLVVPNPLRWTTPLPARLEPGSSATHYWKLLDVRNCLLEHRVDAKDVRMVVNSGHGQSKRKLSERVVRDLNLPT